MVAFVYPNGYVYVNPMATPGDVARLTVTTRGGSHSATLVEAHDGAPTRAHAFPRKRPDVNSAVARSQSTIGAIHIVARTRRDARDAGD